MRRTVILGALLLGACDRPGPAEQVATNAAAPAAGRITDDERTFDARDPAAVAGALRRAGYKAEIKADKDGDPFIASALNGSPFTIDFYGCEQGRCNSFQFRSWFPHEPIFTADLANEWNREKRFIYLAVDAEGDLNQYMDVTALGRLTYANFADWVDWYETMDARVNTFVAEKRKAGAAAARVIAR